ncbi:MAG: stage V sporulation protein D [Bacilli bacterium]|nr:stage V sporulation protein D [Bacilli bacterium]
MKQYRLYKTKRIVMIYIIILIGFIFLFTRLSYVKIVKGQDYYNLALDLWTRTAPTKGVRGNIYDRNGNLIVGSYLAPTVVVIPKQIEDKDYAANFLSEVLEVSKKEILKHLNKKVSVEILKPSGRYISVDKAIKIINKNIKGVYVVSDSKRSYPYNDILAPIIGVVGSDNQGITGIEYIYDQYLKGGYGGLNIYTDAHGNLISDLTSYYNTALSGADVYLTIDLNIQLILERLLDNAFVKYNYDEAIMIAVNPKTSEVLGMASRPTFNPENYLDYSEEVYNRNLPIWKNYEPGSVQKIITYAAGLEENVFKMDETYNDPGYLIIDGVRIKDWKVGGHGTETFLQVIENSCNPGFMTIGMRLGKDKLFKYIKNFGLGSKTGIDLLGESSGILFNEEKIGNVELATASFGQGNAVTAIQLVNAASAAVNGGILHKPYVLSKIVREDELILKKEAEMIRRVISNETSEKVKYALESVASRGTARGAFIDGYRVGGKTGTAQIAENGGYVSGKYILSFMGIAPMNDPEVLIYLAITNPKNTIQYGGVVCAPIVKEALQESFPILNIKPSNDGISLDARYYIDKRIFLVDDYLGMKVKSLPYTNKYNFIIEGNGNIVVSQVPAPGERLIEGGNVIIYTGE